MPFDGEREVACLHPLAVVLDNDEISATRPRPDVNAPGISVERILDKLLHRARRSLDHLASCDAIDGSRSKTPNLHGASLAAFQAIAFRLNIPIYKLRAVVARTRCSLYVPRVSGSIFAEIRIGGS